RHRAARVAGSASPRLARRRNLRDLHAAAVHGDDELLDARASAARSRVALALRDRCAVDACAAPVGWRAGHGGAHAARAPALCASVLRAHALAQAVRLARLHGRGVPRGLRLLAEPDEGAIRRRDRDEVRVDGGAGGDVVFRAIYPASVADWRDHDDHPLERPGLLADTCRAPLRHCRGRCLAPAGLLYAIGVRALMPLSQGAGWGFRLVHDELGCLALVAACGVEALTRAIGGRRTAQLVAVSFATTIVAQLPMRATDV